VIETQLLNSYESSSSLRDAFSKIMEAAPLNSKKHLNILKSSWLDTQLGPMLAIADDEKLYLLEFIERRGLEREIQRLKINTNSAITPRENSIILSIKKEIDLYFAGKLKEFHTPIFMLGSPFQQQTWHALMKIPYGKTISYAMLATNIGKPSAFRAVANANGANQLAILIPCHRVINSNGKLSGYGGGIAHKQWMIDLEEKALKPI